MTSTWESATFSVDLSVATVDLIEFLREVNSHPCLHNGQFFLQAINRYERLWLPLAGKYPQEQLTAPLDVAWVWHCHMLHPISYRKDCVALAGCIVDHKLKQNCEKESSLAISQQYWMQMYSEPFEVRLDGSMINPNFQQPPLSSCDLTKAVSRQRTFFYQVSLPHFNDQGYLDMCVQRYKKFLYLRQNNPDNFCVPCYGIGVVQHAHQLHPLLYQKDTEELLGQTFNHENSDTEPFVEFNFNHTTRTKELWRSTFNEDFAVSGAMYRGISPKDILYTLTENDLSSILTRSSIFIFEYIHLTGFSTTSNSLKLKMHLEYRNLEYKNTVVGKLGYLKPGGQLNKSEWQAKELSHLKFDTKDVRSLKFEVIEKKGRACFGSTTVLGEGQYLMSSLFEISESAAVQVNETVTLSSDLKMEFKGTMGAPVRRPCKLFLSQGRYENCAMPEAVEELWGPVHLPMLEPGVEHSCQVATYRMMKPRTVFTVRIVHSLSLLMSAVHVFFQEKMIAVAHLVDSDQIPPPSQVRNPELCFTLNPRAGERAVLIKNNHGDWALVKGCWMGFTKGVSCIPGERTPPGSPGYLTFQIYYLSTGLIVTRNLTGYLRQDFRVTLQSFHLDLKKGYISLDKDTDDVAENIALAFSLSLLHVLCQPRPDGWQPGDPIEKENTSLDEETVPSVPSQELAFIKAAGFGTYTPSNYYISHTMRSSARGTEESETQVL